MAAVNDFYDPICPAQCPLHFYCSPILFYLPFLPFSIPPPILILPFPSPSKSGFQIQLGSPVSAVSSPEGRGRKSILVYFQPRESSNNFGSLRGDQNVHRNQKGRQFRLYLVNGHTGALGAMAGLAQLGLSLPRDTPAHDEGIPVMPSDSKNTLSRVLY